MTEAPIIKADGLTRHFGPLTAVDHLSLEVSPGEIFGLVGPDGAGKTTVLRLLTGLVEPDAGSALVTGYDSARHPEKVKDNIGYMAQRFGLYPDLSVDENMGFYADLFGMSPAEALWTPWRLAAQLQLAADQKKPVLPKLAKALRDQGYPGGQFTGRIFAGETLGDYLLFTLRPGTELLAYNHVHLFPRAYWQDIMTALFGSPGWWDVLNRHGVNLIVIEADMRKAAAAAKA